MTSLNQVRFLTLNFAENNDSQVFRLEKSWTLQFLCGPTLTGRVVRLFVNHPTTETKSWVKSTYRELEWTEPTAPQFDVCESHAEVTMVQAGSFRYYFTVNGSESEEDANGRGYFLVDPDLRIGDRRDTLPLDGIICQTVLSKLLGPFPEWMDRLLVAKETGYNVIHFTPLQELGASNSAYGLKDQMKLNPVFNTPDFVFDFGDVEKFVKRLQVDHGMLSFTDVVLNHTANESPWIFEHPESVYNLVNSPHLKPAYILDRRLVLFSLEVADGLWIHRGLPPEIKTEDHLVCISDILHTTVLPELRLAEFFQVSVDEVLTAFRDLILRGIHKGGNPGVAVEVIPDPTYRRLCSTVDLSLAIKIFYSSQPSNISEDERMELATTALRKDLERLNSIAATVMSGHLLVAVRNFVSNARWNFVDPKGLRLPLVTHKQRIMNRYFVHPYGNLTMEEEEKLIHTEKSTYCMAHNGWLLDVPDPFSNFAKVGSNVYLRREVNSWEDSVKLRYEEKPDDSPYLWKLMRDYVRQTASIFHGIRLDNCHNTPIHVLEWALAEARSVRPDLYVVAELFTVSESFDNIFINRLGLNSLIREALGQYSPHDLSNYLLKFSREPVGAFFQLPLRPITTSSPTHDMMYDQTHDNPSIVEKRSSLDSLPNAALVAMATCAMASNRGYDEVVPHYLSITSESRFFRKWNADGSAENSVGLKTGIIAAKKALNHLHWKLVTKGFRQLMVNHHTDAIVTVTRHNPITHESMFLVAHTAFSKHAMGLSNIPRLRAPGTVREILLEATVTGDGGKTFVDHPELIVGFDDVGLDMQENIEILKSQLVRIHGEEDEQDIEFLHFPPGSIIIFRLSLGESAESSALHLRLLLASFGRKMRPSVGPDEAAEPIDDCEPPQELFTKLSLADLNRVMFRCDAEERDDGFGYSVYNIPGFGDLPFCGLAGVMSVLGSIRASDDLDHPLCRNLKEGNWLMDYISGRLLLDAGTRNLGSWLQKEFENIKNLPRVLVPCYFDAFMTGVYSALEEQAWNRMTDFIKKGSPFLRALGLASLQLCGVSGNSPLPALSPHLEPPYPTVVDDGKGHTQITCSTISAGLPHFSVGMFRCWGRDTFVSLRGLMLVTGRFEDARFIILAFGGYLRHGLIPNFLGSGNAEPRYNSRDAVWWWLQSIQDYCKMAPHGIAILKDKVSRRYLTDSGSPLPPGKCDQLLCDVMQEALQVHASGTRFRERDAGPGIDKDMTEAGFDLEIGVDWKTGFVFGGSEHNCGTWMDKMGSSESAGNLGKPATPRDGSAVELVALCYSTTKWLSVLVKDSLYPHPGVSIVEDGATRPVTFEKWNSLVAENFESKFWIDDNPHNDPRPELVNRRGIYKDVVGSAQTWAEYQLRPNFSIALALAPDMCNIDHAWAALERAGEVLMGPLGMKTLDPSDMVYSGNYSCNDCSAGFNYHQGPEWIWPVGFFLRAIVQVAQRLEEKHEGILKDTLTNVRRILSAHNTYIHASFWKSLPELTNANGEFCGSSCPSQAWSVASILDALYDVENILVPSSNGSGDHSQAVAAK